MAMIEVSNGEIVDRYTILMLKLRKINDDVANTNIRFELETITPFFKEIVKGSDVEYLATRLAIVNEKLWNVEDRLRLFEKSKVFDDVFIQNARSVYELNDERSKLKKMINTITKSHIVEEKSYEKY